MVALIALLYLWTASRSRQLLESWARENGLEIVSSEFRWFRRGPFFWTTSSAQRVFHVTVRMPDGGTRGGWVRCGGFWGGLLQDRVEVRWDA
jgi:hypothetical protein